MEKQSLPRQHIPLAQAIQLRRSVRRYDRRDVPPCDLERIEARIKALEGLPGEGAFSSSLRSITADDLAAVGPYGRLLNSPYSVVPCMLGGERPLVSLGYRMERLALDLTQMGLGSCFVGALGSETRCCQRFGLPEGARIGALLIFGYSSPAAVGSALNRLVRRAAGAERRLAPEQIYHEQFWDHPAAPPSDLASVVEAARLAPSAKNAQPWRLLQRGDALHLYVTRVNRRYGTGSSLEYRFFDGGICMANMSAALEAAGRGGRWLFDSADRPPETEELEYLATLRPDVDDTGGKA